MMKLKDGEQKAEASSPIVSERRSVDLLLKGIQDLKRPQGGYRDSATSLLFLTRCLTRHMECYLRLQADRNQEILSESKGSPVAPKIFAAYDGLRILIRRITPVLDWEEWPQVHEALEALISTWIELRSAEEKLDHFVLRPESN